MTRQFGLSFSNDVVIIFHINEEKKRKIETLKLKQQNEITQKWNNKYNSKPQIEKKTNNK